MRNKLLIVVVMMLLSFVFLFTGCDNIDSNYVTSSKSSESEVYFEKEESILSESSSIDNIDFE